LKRTSARKVTTKPAAKRQTNSGAKDVKKRPLAKTTKKTAG
jgi:hypothetical protein